MREIKFRVWCRNRNEWEKDICFIGLDGDVYQQRFASPVMLPVNKKNHIIMQYTGLKDKNGVEIYEGDIYQYKYYFDNMKYEYKKLVVEWDRTDVPYYGSFHGYEFDERYIEVIGNIYENSELLEKEN